ncbi:hypothetical protein, partial [Microbacterium sp. KNMS]
PKGVFSVNVEDVGAPIDGAGDAGAPIQARINSWTGALGTLKLTAPPGSQLRFTQGLNVKNKDVVFDFTLCHLIKATTDPILTAEGSWGPVVSVGGVAGRNTLTLADSSGFKSGDVVKVFSDDLIWDARPREDENSGGTGTAYSRQGQFTLVSSITSATQMSVNPSLIDDYTLNIRVAKLNEHNVDFRFGTAEALSSAPGPMFRLRDLRFPILEGRILR